MYYVNSKTGFFCENPSAPSKRSKTKPSFRFLETVSFEAAFLDGEGEPLDLTGGTFLLSLSADLGKDPSGNIIAFSDAGSCEIVNPANGIVRFHLRCFSSAFAEAVAEEQEIGRIEAVYTPAGELEGKVILSDSGIRLLPRVYTGEIQTEDLALNYYTKGEIDSFLSGFRFALAACSGMGEILEENAFTMTWIDPDNVTLNGATLAAWNQTVLVRKVGSYPADHTDGTILAATSRALGNKNAYRSTGYTDSDRTEGTTYFYKLFSQTTAGVWNNLTGNQFAESTSMSWGMVQAFVRAGRGAELFPVGTVFEVEHPEYTVDGHGIYFRVSGHDQVPAADETLTHTMCLEMVDVIFSAPYDNPEYLYALTEDTTAQAGKTYYTYANGTYSAIAEGTDYDVGDPVPEGSWYEKNINSSRAANGSNNPVHSNLIQWANSGGAANQWFEKQTLWDTCNTTLAEKNGFCRNIDPEFLAVVKLANLYSRTCDAEGHLLVAHNAKFWPLSRTQIVNSSGSENEFLAFYANGGSAKKMLAGTSTYRSWATRSVYKDNTFTVLRVMENGTSANNSYLDAAGSGGISLACIIA